MQIIWYPQLELLDYDPHLLQPVTAVCKTSLTSQTCSLLILNLTYLVILLKAALRNKCNVFFIFAYENVTCETCLSNHNFSCEINIFTAMFTWGINMTFQDFAQSPGFIQLNQMYEIFIHIMHKSTIPQDQEMVFGVINWLINWLNPFVRYRMVSSTKQNPAQSWKTSTQI